MLLSALVIIGCFLCASSKMKKDELPVFRPTQIEVETEETEQKEIEQEETKGAADKTQYKAEDNPENPEQERTAEALLPGGQTAAEDMYLAEADRGMELPAAGHTGDDETEKHRDILEVSSDFVKKAEKKAKTWIDIPDSMWIEDKTKTLVALSYKGGFRERYCVGATDMKVEEILIYAQYSDGSSSRVSPLLFQTEGFSAEEPGNFQGKISFQGVSVMVPYEVVDFQAVLHLNGGACIGTRENVYHLYDYTLESVEPPQRTGYAFDGWFLEEELITAAEFPFYASEQISHLYAGWKKYETSYTSEDGILILPDSCTAVGERAFSNAEGIVEEVYVGAGVSEIAPGAFFGLDDLSYIDVDWKNSHYTTINCGLYTKDGKRLEAYPNALSGICRVYAGTEALGKYAFYESRILTLILPEKLKSIEGFAFGKNLKTLRFQGMTPPESLSREAFAGISEDLVIEVPQSALESYRETLGKISPALAEKAVGFQKE